LEHTPIKLVSSEGIVNSRHGTGGLYTIKGRKPLCHEKEVRKSLNVNNLAGN